MKEYPTNYCNGCPYKEIMPSGTIKCSHGICFFREEAARKRAWIKRIMEQREKEK